MNRICVSSISALRQNRSLVMIFQYPYLHALVRSLKKSNESSIIKKIQTHPVLIIMNQKETKNLM